MEEVVAVLAKLPEYLHHVELILVAVIGLAMVIPGDQPEKALQKVVDVIAKFSKKK